MQSIAPIKEHHRVRSLLSSFFGAIALSFISLSILVIWLNSTLTNTDQYVKTVGPMAQNLMIQDFIADQATGIFLEGEEAPVGEIADHLLGSSLAEGKTDEELKVQVKPILQEDIKQALASPQFASLWDKNNEDIHSQFVTQLAGDSSTMTLNFHPLIVGAIDILTTTKLNFLKDKIDIKDDVGRVNIPSEQLVAARKFYDYSGELVIAIVTAAVITLIITLAISENRFKTLRRIVFSAGLSAGLLALSLSLPSVLAGQEARPEQQKFALALVDIFVRDLRTNLIIIASICIGIVVIYKIVELTRARLGR
jgi:hypothetical protein